MATARQLIAIKGARVASLPPTATVLQAAQLMNDRHIGSVLVIDRNRLVGIFTERDVMRRIVAEERSAADTTLDEVMTLTEHASKVIMFVWDDRFSGQKVLQDRVLSNPKVEVRWYTSRYAIHGVDDDISPISGTEQFVAARPGEVELLRIEGATHGDAWNVAVSEYEEAVVSFVQRVAGEN